MWLIFELSVALHFIQCPSPSWSSQRFGGICTLCAIPEGDCHANEHKIPLSATLDSTLRPARFTSCRLLEPPLICKSTRSVKTLQCLVSQALLLQTAANSLPGLEVKLQEDVNQKVVRQDRSTAVVLGRRRHLGQELWQKLPNSHRSQSQRRALACFLLQQTFAGKRAYTRI